MKSLHLLVEKHKYQYLILASLILVACFITRVTQFLFIMFITKKCVNFGYFTMYIISYNVYNKLQCI